MRMLVQTARRSLGALIVVAGAIASVPARGADLWQPLFAAGKEAHRRGDVEEAEKQVLASPLEAAGQVCRGQSACA